MYARMSVAFINIEKYSRTNSGIRFAFNMKLKEKILDDLLKRCGIWLLAAALALIIIAAPLRLTAAPLSYSNLLKNGNFCARSIAKEERRLGIPHRLLHALSIKESGRWVKEDRANITWPWTVNAGGNGRHFNNRQNAIRHVRKLQKEGKRNIDIGCMQINLHYHPNAFKTIEAGFDPATNVAYAAKFLSALKENHGTWQLAVRHYHSANQTKSGPYQNKVFQIWKAALRSGNTSTAIADAQENRNYSPTARIDSGKQAAKRTYGKFFAELKRKFPHRFGTSKRSGTPNRKHRAANLLAVWPPRGYAAQRRAENLARAWSFSKRSRVKPAKLSP